MSHPTVHAPPRRLRTAGSQPWFALLVLLLSSAGNDRQPGHRHAEPARAKQRPLDPLGNRASADEDGDGDSRNDFPDADTGADPPLIVDMGPSRRVRRRCQ